MLALGALDRSSVVLFFFLQNQVSSAEVRHSLARSQKNASSASRNLTLVIIINVLGDDIYFFFSVLL